MKVLNNDSSTRVKIGNIYKTLRGSPCFTSDRYVQVMDIVFDCKPTDGRFNRCPFRDHSYLQYVEFRDSADCPHIVILYQYVPDPYERQSTEIVSNRGEMYHQCVEMFEKFSKLAKESKKA